MSTRFENGLRGAAVALAATVLFSNWESNGRQSAFADQAQDAERRGMVVGMATAKGGYWIEIKADGEERARRYFCGSNPEALKAVAMTEVGSRVRLEWRFEEVFRVVKIDVLKAPGP
jgi:hypothetical protein